jgi:hypothetical protein
MLNLRLGMAWVSLNGQQPGPEALSVDVSKGQDLDVTVSGTRTSFGTFSNLVAVDMEIEFGHLYNEVAIFGKFLGKTASIHSRAGIWVGVTDRPTFRLTDQPNRLHDSSQFFEINPTETSTGVDIRQWKFGPNPEIRIKANQGHQNRSQAIKIILIASPFFGVDVHDKPVELELEFVSRDGKKVIDEFTTKIEFKMNPNRALPVDIIETHSALGAFESSGIGYSVHPKQLYTAHYLTEVINKIRVDQRDKPFPKQTLEVAYIGPDTTENLRSMLRASENEDIRFSVFQNPEWDSPAGVYPFQGGNKAIDQISNVDLFDTSPDGFEATITEVGKKDFDIIICTYVGYWALSDKDSESRYGRLLKTLSRRNTKVITVDARDPQYCVLSRPPDNVGWNDLETFYKTTFGPKPRSLFWNQKDNRGVNGQIVPYIWERGN